MKTWKTKANKKLKITEHLILMKTLIETSKAHPHLTVLLVKRQESIYTSFYAWLVLANGL